MNTFMLKKTLVLTLLLGAVFATYTITGSDRSVCYATVGVEGCAASDEDLVLQPKGQNAKPGETVSLGTASSATGALKLAGATIEDIEDLCTGECEKAEETCLPDGFSNTTGATGGGGGGGSGVMPAGIGAEFTWGPRDDGSPSDMYMTVGSLLGLPLYNGRVEATTCSCQEAPAE